MARKSYHVIPDFRKGWSVLKRGATRASRHFATKQEAIAWGREMSRKHKYEFVIHREDGTVQQKDYY